VEASFAHRRFRKEVGVQTPGHTAAVDPAEAAPLVVIPCFNEEHRLDVARLGALAASGRARLLFVDDGSSDGTAAVLDQLSSTSDAIDVLHLPRNVGKAEAIRQGLLLGLESDAPILAYYDADLATPPEELLRLLELLQARTDLTFVMASRVLMLGWRMERRAYRHYLGRVFATIASLLLRIPVYDTQCGAKVFRVTPELREAISSPFRSSWVFDVELIGRLLRGSETAEPVPLPAFEEMPLRAWRDVSGSRLGPIAMSRALIDLLLVGWTLRRGHR
jgi:glycosyltransferase involved in cell wall biosynthesis